LFRGYNPNKKVFNQEVELIHDLEPIEVAEAEAEKFECEHGDKCGVWALVKPVNGLSSSKKVPASSSLRLSNLVVLLRFRCGPGAPWRLCIPVQNYWLREGIEGWVFRILPPDQIVDSSVPYLFLPAIKTNI
jgi:hypothetical protein